MYTIHEVKDNIPQTYILKDLKGDVIEVGFYNEELQKAEQEVFRIKKILRKKKIKGVEHALVKWIGYDNTFSKWIPSTILTDVMHRKV